MKTISMFFSYKNWISLVFAFFLFEGVWATGQAPDLLIIKKDTFYLFSNPLEPYLGYRNQRTINGIELIGTSTGCVRGYIATWEIENDSLFLVKIVHETDSGRLIIFNLEEEFGQSNVFASWFTGTLYSPGGDMLQYYHFGYASIYEKEEYYHLWNGQVKSTESRNNLTYDITRLYPAEAFLRDTLTRIIASKLGSELLEEIPDSSVCFLHVQYNKDGEVENIEPGREYYENTLFGKTILATAEEELIKLPPLMTVTHPEYRPPRIPLWFFAYCIKYPWDRAYGCRE